MIEEMNLEDTTSGDSNGREGLPNRPQEVGILASFLLLWEPTGETMRALRENAEAHAETLVEMGVELT